VKRGMMADEHLGHFPCLGTHKLNSTEKLCQHHFANGSMECNLAFTDQWHCVRNTMRSMCSIQLALCTGAISSLNRSKERISTVLDEEPY